VIGRKHYVGQALINFPRDIQRTEVLGTNQVRVITVTKWPFRSTIQCFMAFLIDHIFMTLTLLLLQNNPVLTFWITAKINGLSNQTH